MTPAQAIIPTIISQYADEAAFLWIMRNNVVDAPHCLLKDLVKHDGRLEAHLDGLRVAGEHGWELCKAALGNEEAGEVFAASVMAFESGIESRIQAVLDVVLKTPELSKGLISALGWIAYEQISSHIERLIHSESPTIQRVGLAAKAVHRKDPGPVLQTMLGSSDAPLRMRALETVSELGHKNLLGVVRENLKAEDNYVRYWAAWSGALLGEPAAIPVLLEFVESGHPKREQTCALALRRMSIEQGHAWLKTLASHPGTLRLSVQAAGVIGNPANIPWLIQQTANPMVARVAGESFTYITGVDLAYADLDTDKPEGFEGGPTENLDDENVEMDADEDLPWPHPQIIEQWWSAHRVEFTNGTRYLLGKPMEIKSLNHALRSGKQRQRIAAALELAIRQPGTPLFNTSAPGFRQQALLGLGR